MNDQFNGTSADDLQVGGDHYKKMAIEPWVLMESILTREEFVGYLKGNILKYCLRDGRKNGSTDDAEKARHYMKKLNEIFY